MENGECHDKIELEESTGFDGCERRVHMLDLLLANARMNIGNEDAVLFQIFMYLAAAAAAVGGFYGLAHLLGWLIDRLRGKK